MIQNFHWTTSIVVPLAECKIDVPIYELSDSKKVSTSSPVKVYPNSVGGIPK